MKTASLFHPKAKLWMSGRKQQTFQKLKSSIWFHASSLGEFEQGRILIEKIKKDYPSTPVVLTFFSPSGYEVRKNYIHADYIYYLPIDNKKNVTNFYNTINPKLIVFIKYDLWWNYIKEAQKRDIPFYLIAAFLKEKDYFIKYDPFKSIYKNITTVFYQDIDSLKLAKSINQNSPLKAGDTRVDSVIETAKAPLKLPLIKEWTKGKKVLVGGSSWHKEIELIRQYYSNQPLDRWIVAPHDISESFLEFIENNLGEKNCIRHSQLADKGMNKPILIIDSIGKLSSIYQFGKIAFIGGAFAKGLHNTLEPIAHGVPCIFGPKYNRFIEAEYLVKNGGAISIDDYASLEAAIKKLSNDHEAPIIARKYIDDAKGSSDLIYKHLIQHL